MFKKVLIANRGEIACRIIKTLRKMGIVSVAIYSQVDERSLHREMADESYLIGTDNTTANSYSNIKFVIDIAKKAKVDAIHPGYGLLSEDFHFAQRVAEEGINFIGPHYSLMERMSDKKSAKIAAANAGVSVVPGFKGEIRDYMHALQIADEIGYPVMIKAAAGGGGKGMRVVHERSEMEFMYNMALQEAAKLYENTTMLVEKFIEDGRHIEMQILGDKHGNIVCLSDRECSIQRRNQKIIEEAPSPFMTKSVRQKMIKECLQFAKKENYYSAGTIEFIVDKHCNFYFLEVNTRIQVEHRITEMLTGIDIVEQMILVACDQKLPFKQKDIKPDGHAFECRICAEDASNDFIPSSGTLTEYFTPETKEYDYNAKDNGVILIDTGVGIGDEISPYYDSMIAKACVKEKNRGAALTLMQQVLNQIYIKGITTNISFLSAILAHEDFQIGNFSTKFIEQHYPDGFDVRAMDSKWLHVPLFAVLCHHLHENFQAHQLKSYQDLLHIIGDKFVIMIENEHCVEIKTRTIKKDNVEHLIFLFSKTDHEISFEIANGPFMQILLHRENDKKEKIVEQHFVFIGREKHYGYRTKFFSMELSLKVFNDNTAKFLHEIPWKSFADEGPSEKEIISSITGMVSAVNVQIGDSVEKNQVLCVISAMKMENPIKINRAAKIKNLHIKVGNTVQAGDLLFELE